MANIIEIAGYEATLDKSGVWTCDDSGIAGDLNRECTPWQYSPALGNPFLAAVRAAVEDFGAKVISTDATVSGDAGVVY